MSGLSETPSPPVVNHEDASVFVQRPSRFLQRSQSRNKCYRIPKRYIMAFMCCLAFYLKSWINLNFGIIIYHVLTQEPEERNILYPKSSEWTWKQLEFMDTASDVGFVLGQIPGALLCTVYSSHKIFAISLSSASIFHMLLPLMLNQHIGAVSAVHFLQGLSMGPIFPALFGLWKEWAPPGERSFLLILAFSGKFMGTLTGIHVGLSLIYNVNPSACFIVPGICGLIWSLLWCNLTYESPSNDPKISHTELLYLEDNIPLDSKVQVTLRSIPLKSILTSLPVISLCTVFFCTSFCFEMDATAHNVLQFGLSEAGFHHLASWSKSVPYVSFILVLPASGLVADFCIRKTHRKNTIIRKAFCSGALTLHGILLFATCNPDEFSAVILFNLALMVVGISLAGFIPNVMELTSRYICIIMGIAGTCWSLGSIAWPFVIEEFVPDDSLLEWWKIMVIEGTVSVVAAALFAIFGSGFEQSWSSSEVPEINRTSDAECYPKNNVEDTTIINDEML